MQINYEKKYISVKFFHFFAQSVIFLCKLFGNFKYFSYLCNRVMWAALLLWRLHACVKPFKIIKKQT